MQLEFLDDNELHKLRLAVAVRVNHYKGYLALHEKLANATKIVLEIGEPEISKSKPKKRKG